MKAAKSAVWKWLIPSIAILILGYWIVSGLEDRRLRGRLPETPLLNGFPREMAEAVENAESEVGVSDKGIDRLSTLARLYHANGFYSEAEQCYRLLTERQPNDAESQYLLYDSMQKTGRAAEGKDYLLAVLELEPRYITARIKLGNLLYKTGSSDQAIRVYDEVLTQSPNNVYALLGIARDRMRNGQNDEAMELLNRAVKEDSGFGPAHILLARLHDKRGDSHKAALARELGERSGPYRDPEDPWLDGIMTYCYDASLLAVFADRKLTSANVRSAMNLLDRAERLKPGDSNLKVLRARFYAKLGLWEESAQAYSEALELGGDADSLRVSIAHIYRDNGKSEAAKRALKQGLRQNPNSEKLLTALAEFKLDEGLNNEALLLIEKALVADSKSYDANRIYGRLLWEAGRETEAMERLEVVRQLSPTDFTARMTLAQVYLQNKDNEQAKELLLEAMAIDPDHKGPRMLAASVCLRIANQAFRDGELLTALDGYDEALEYDPELMEAYANKAQLLAREQRYAEADRTLTSYLRIKPDADAVRMFQGDIQAYAGRIDAARLSWEKVMARQLEGADLEAAISERLKKIQGQ